MIGDNAEAPRARQALTLSPEVERGALARLLPAARPWTDTSWVSIGVITLVMLVLPWALTLVDGGNYVTHLIITFFVWGIAAQCWNLIMGVSGIYSFGQLALFQVGAFTTGVLSFSVGLTPWVSIWAAPIVAVIAALIIGLPTLRLRGIYVVLLTLAFHELLRNWITTGPQWISGGGYGLARVPKLGFEGVMGPQYEKVFYYYFGLVFFGLATYAIWRILNSPIGLAFKALRDSEDYAISRGVDPFRFKLFLFAFSAFFTGLAGGFSAHYNGSASTSLFDFGVMINLLVMIVLGGWGTFAGPIVGTAILTFLTELLRAFDLYRILALGIAMGVIAVAAPEGLVPLFTRAFHSLFGVFFEPGEPPAPGTTDEPNEEADATLRDG